MTTTTTQAIATTEAAAHEARIIETFFQACRLDEFEPLFRLTATREIREL